MIDVLSFFWHVFYDVLWSVVTHIFFCVNSTC